MILIADSGATKTTWEIVTKGEIIRTIQTKGINPYHFQPEEIIRLLENEWIREKQQFRSIYFYGAGCTPEKKGVIHEALSAFFKPEIVDVHSDLLAAAHALCQYQPGIACILGTGSNSCLYDGEKIVSNISPLGYILGDEGSGAVLGRTLLGDILKKQLPEEIRESFFTTYSTHTSEILEYVYRKPLANVYLAQYTQFIAKNIDHPAIEALVKEEFRKFFRRNVLQYENTSLYPVHFTGSIAFVFQQQIRSVAEEMGLTIGNIQQSPMEGLVKYHLENNH